MKLRLTGHADRALHTVLSRSPPWPCHDSLSSIAQRTFLEEGFAGEPPALPPSDVRPAQVEADAAEERERRDGGEDDVLSGEH